MKRIFLILTIFAIGGCYSKKSDVQNQEPNKVIYSEGSVIIHAPVEESFTCSEHWDGQFLYLGDALGTDCVIQEFYNKNGRMFMKLFQNEGLNNEDWFGFGKNVLAPCDCVVTNIHNNDMVNKPGIINPGRAGSITFEMNDGTKIIMAHLDNIILSEGEYVKRGDNVAKVGNNGYSRNPHLHIAAWHDAIPLQIRFDQKTIGIKMREQLNNETQTSNSN